MNKKAVLAVALMATAGAAGAADPCATPGTSWSCIGVVDMRWKANGESGSARLTRYDNGETQAEFSGRTGRKRMLTLPGIVLYSGLTEEDAAQGNPFAFFDYAFALPGLAMQAAFPDGPGSVPQERVQKSVEVDGKRFRLSIVRPSHGGIQYQVESQDEMGFQFSGTWNEARARPLPGSFPLSRWTHGAACEPRTLAEARSDCRPPP